MTRKNILLTRIAITLSSLFVLSNCGREASKQDNPKDDPKDNPKDAPKDNPNDAPKDDKPAAELENPCLRLENEGFLKSKNGSWHAAIKWRAGPAVSPTESVAQLIVANSDCIVSTEKVANLKVKPWMSVHGHGAPTNALVVKKDGNDFTITGLYFVMSGPWELQFDFVDTTGATDNVEFKVNVP